MTTVTIDASALSDYRLIADAFAELLASPSGEGIFRWSDERAKNVADALAQRGFDLSAKNLIEAREALRRMK